MTVSTATDTKTKRTPRPSRAGKWRAIVLILVHVAIALHVAHWATTGRTVSPVEPSETMYFLEKGEFNAGTVFFAVAILLTLIFGRFVCGWACHLVALQDLCGWLMKKIGIRPKLFRSRLLVYVPLLLALYMFAWPSFVRFVVYPALEAWSPGMYASLQPLPPLPGWSNHLVTDDFWKTFATLEVAIPFLFICTFGAVYFLGAKGFCTYGCPYGGIFFPADRLAVGRIKADLSVCEGCAQCTAHCTSNVRIHEEIQLHEAVVNPGCMKCLDCVSVCPTKALSYGFARPQLLRRGVAKKTRKYDLTWPEEITFALFALFSFWSVRGLYGKVPMLFAVGIAGCATFLVWKLWRIMRDRDVRLHRWALKKGGQVAASGRLYSVGVVLLVLTFGHSATVKTHQNRAEANFIELRSRVNFEMLLRGAPAKELYEGEIEQLAREAYESYARLRPFWDHSVEPSPNGDGSGRKTAAGGWGLLPSDGIDKAQGALALILGDLPLAESHYARSVAENPDDGTVFQLARVRALWAQRPIEGPQAPPEVMFRPIVELLEPIVAAHPDFSSARQELATVYRLGLNQLEKAVALYEKHLENDPTDQLARGRLALEVLAPAGARERAFEVLASGLDVEGVPPKLDATLRDTFVKAARFYGPQDNEMIALLEDGLKRRPDWFEVRRELVLLHRKMKRREKAAALYEEWGGSGETMTTRASLYYGWDVLLQFGEVDAARAALDRARADKELEDERHHEFAAAYATLLRGLHARGDSEQAYALGRELVASGVPYGAVFQQLCQLWILDKRGEEAIQFCRDYLEKNPLESHTRAFFAIGVLVEWGRQMKDESARLRYFEEAVTELEKAAEYAPRDAFVLADLALAYYNVKRMNDAVAAMDRSLTRSPHNPQLVARMVELADQAQNRPVGERWRKVAMFQQRYAGRR